MLVVRRTGGDVEWTEGATCGGTTSSSGQPDHARGAGVRRRAPAVHPVHLGHHRQAQGHPAHHRRLPRRRRRYTHRHVFDLKPETDVYWCTADIGWVTGHSYIVYGPLANGATQVMYEGTPDTPHRGRWWEIVEKYKVTILYTAPTTIRTFMKWGDDDPDELRPVVAAAARSRSASRSTPRRGCGTASTSAATAARSSTPGGRPRPAAIMISPLPGRHRDEARLGHGRVPGHRGRRRRRRRRPGRRTAAAATSCSPSRGRRCCAASGATTSATSTPTGRRFAAGYYFAGDGAKHDEDGDLWLLGRVDDVMNVSGHRLSTTEVESALVSHPTVAEAAVVGATDDTTGQAIVAFVILRGESGSRATRRRPTSIAELRDHVRPRDRPDRQAAPDHGRRRAAQDPLGQDHAPAAARRRRAPRGRRRHDARRPDGHGPHLRRARTPGSED